MVLTGVSGTGSLSSGGRAGSTASARIQPTTGGDQHANRAGEGRPCRADGESGQASQERPFTPDPVRPALGHQHQPGEDHDVCVDYPLELACKSRTNVGSTTLRTVLSRFTISSETHRTPSASQRRGGDWPSPTMPC